MHTSSLRIRAPWNSELRMVELAPPGPGWVRVEVEACGICGTDLTAAASRAKDWEAVGHEIAGRIAELGSDVSGLAVGQRVALESGSFCGRCPSCRDGRVDLCYSRAPNFWGQAAMGMSGQMLAPAVCCVPYEGLEPWQACLAEPVGVAYDLVRTAGIEMGQSVCVVGPGPIGLAAVALAKHRGAATLVCLGTAGNPERLGIATQLGATTAVWDGRSVPDALAKRFDHVLMTAPTACIAPALGLLAYGGIQSFIGIGEGDGTISFDANDFHFRKLQLRSSFAAPAIYFPAVLRLLAAGIVPAELLVSHRLPLARAAEAFALCRERKDSTRKIVIEPQQG